MQATNEKWGNPGKGCPASATNGTEPTTRAATGASQGQWHGPSRVRNDASWFKLGAGRLLSLSHHEPDDLKYAKRHREIALALAMQELGMDMFADELMLTTAETMKSASDHGRKGADGRWKKEQGMMLKQCPSNARVSDGEGEKCPSNGIRDMDRKTEKKDRERKPGAAGAAALSQYEIPSREAVNSFGNERGFSPERVEKCFQHYEASGWRDTQGHPVQNWRSKVSSWMNRPELGQPNETATPISPEDSRQKEANERRERDIRNAAETIQARLSWIEAGEKYPYGDATAEIETARSKIEKHYGSGALPELEKAVAEVKDEKRLEAERRKVRQ